MKLIYNISKFLILLTSLYLTSCSGCSNTGQQSRTSSKPSNRNEEKIGKVIEERNVKQTSKISFRKENGVLFLPVEINGTKMDFIFDTGASIISISQTEARFLIKQKTLTINDVLGDVNFSDANGDITPGMVVNIKSVKIGNRELENVEAVIVPNDKAPLLLGQSALERFGKVSVDYQKQELILE